MDFSHAKFGNEITDVLPKKKGRGDDDACKVRWQGRSERTKNKPVCSLVPLAPAPLSRT